jgi:hypothetical protein
VSDLNPIEAELAAFKAKTPEAKRLLEDAKREKNWKRWGPYLSGRQWGTVREDYSATGECWDSFPHDHARSRAYRWGEDGLLGITDRECRLCFALSMWNGKDRMLKEASSGSRPRGEPRRGREGALLLPSTHADPRLRRRLQFTGGNTRTRASSKKTASGKAEPEYGRSTPACSTAIAIDVFVEYAKASENDVLVRITVANCGPALDAARAPTPGRAISGARETPHPKGAQTATRAEKNDAIPRKTQRSAPIG